MHFDELCLEPVEGKPTSNRNIIFTMCEDAKTEQNWKYDEQVFFLKIILSFLKN